MKPHLLTIAIALTACGTEADEEGFYCPESPYHSSVCDESNRTIARECRTTRWLEADCVKACQTEATNRGIVSAGGVCSPGRYGATCTCQTFRYGDYTVPNRLLPFQ